MNALEQLNSFCSAKKDPHPGGDDAYILSFDFQDAIVTIRIVFGDPCGADLTITHMTTLPRAQTRNGYGSTAIIRLIAWAKENALREIYAVQVQPPSERFWAKNGFVALNNATNDFALPQLTQNERYSS